MCVVAGRGRSEEDLLQDRTKRNLHSKSPLAVAEMLPAGTSKSIVVTVLKKHSYKCKKCSYKWSVNEPSYGEAEKTTPAEIIYQPVYQAAPSPIQAEAPTVLPYETSTPMVEGTLSTGANR